MVKKYFIRNLPEVTSHLTNLEVGQSIGPIRIQQGTVPWVILMCKNGFIKVTINNTPTRNLACHNQHAKQQLPLKIFHKTDKEKITKKIHY